MGDARTSHRLKMGRHEPTGRHLLVPEVCGGSMLEEDPQQLTRDLRAQATASITWVAFGNIAQALSRVAVLAALARLLDPADFGVTAAALLIITLIQALFQVGVGPVLIQRPQLTRGHIRTATAISLWLGLGTAVLVALGSEAISRTVFRMAELTPFLSCIAWIAPLQSTGAVASALLRRELRFATMAKIQVASYAVGYGAVGIYLAWLGFGAWALILGNLSQAALQSCLALACRPHSWSLLPDRGIARELLYFGGGFTLARVANQLALQGDYLIVGRLLGQEMLGFYKHAFDLSATGTNFLASPLEQVLFPAMSRIQGDPRRLRRVYGRVIAASAGLTLPLSALAVVLAPELVLFVLGPGWEQTVLPFRILSCAIFLRTTYKVSAALARAAGLVYGHAWRQIIYALMVFAFAWAGHPWGVAGVATGVSMAVFLNCVLMAGLTIQITGVSWIEFCRVYARALPSLLLVGAVTAASAEALRTFAPTPVILLGSAGAGTLSYLLALYVAPARLLGTHGLEAASDAIASLRSRVPWVENIGLIRRISAQRSR